MVYFYYEWMVLRVAEVVLTGVAVFCSPPEGAICLTCGTHLRLGDYGGKPAVVQKKKKKRKDRVNGEGRTPVPGETPGPA